MPKLMTCTAVLAAVYASAAFSADSALIEIARKSLQSLQNQSFVTNREYCGMIGRTEAGELVASPARRGRTSGCNPRGFADGTIKPLASYHTHGAFDDMADSEVPSTDDFDMDFSEKIFGFVSTPGGRLWMTDHRSKTVTQICGMGCLPKDPKFKTGMAGDIPKQMTRRQMSQREGKGGPRHLRHSHSLAAN